MFGQHDTETGDDLWVLPLTGERKPYPLVRTRFDETGATVSPDGDWFAYESNETGQVEVNVQSFPKAGNKMQVSVDGGAHPRWKRDGKELFYIAPEGTLTGVTVQHNADGTLALGTPVPLFRARLATGLNTASQRAQYAVASDGRFLLNVVDTDPHPSPLIVLLNWTATLKK
jgi:Tol biopolymer transport system component